MPKAQCDDNCLHNRTCHHTQDIVLFRQTRLTYHWQQYQSTATWSFRANGYGWWFHHPKRLWLWRLTYGAWIFHILRQGALHLFIKISVLTASLLVHPNYKDFANFSNATNKQTRNYPQIQPSQKLVGSVNLSYTQTDGTNGCGNTDPTIWLSAEFKYPFSYALPWWCICRR